MPKTDMAPTMTFQAAKLRARGLSLETINPDRRTPMAENISPAVPVIKLDAEADCLYCVSMYFGKKIQ